MAPVLGQEISGVSVATTIRSRSAAATPAQARARRAATSARSVVSTWEIWRELIPVRSVIHSSEVSQSRSRSSLVSCTGGTHLPQPVIAARRVTGPPHPTPLGCGPRGPRTVPDEGPNRLWPAVLTDLAGGLASDKDAARLGWHATPLGEQTGRHADCCGSSRSGLFGSGCDGGSCCRPHWRGRARRC